MKRCCEYCKHCDEDYETICVLCRVDGGKVDFSKFELTDELAELERKAKAYDNVMAIRNHKDYLLTIVIADLMNNSEVNFYNEKGVEMFVKARGLIESEDE